MLGRALELIFFFFNDTATTEIYTLSLHDALPIYRTQLQGRKNIIKGRLVHFPSLRSEEHTSELQSRFGISHAAFCLKKKKTHLLPRNMGRTRVRFFINSLTQYL